MNLKGNTNPRFLNIWNFYRKDLLDEAANPEHPSTGGTFTSLPRIPSSQMNLKIIGEIGEMADEFVVNVNLATRTKCCFFCCYNKMFGSIEQNLLLL